MPICIVVLIGLPGAGKTTFCTQLVQKLHLQDNFTYHTITYDDIITNYENQYKESRNHAFTTAENTIEAIIHSAQNHILLVDDNMHYKSMRYEYYKLAKKHEISFLQVYVAVELETAVVRNNSREEKCRIPEGIIKDMSEKIEAPGHEAWELNSLSINSNLKFDESTFTQFFEVLHKCLDVPIRNTVQEQEKTGTLPISEMQRIDLVLRKIIHDKLQHDSSQAKVYVAKKKEIYQNIKEHKIVIIAEWTELELYKFLANLF